MRNGKIACLPLEIRTELNRRLDDGRSGKDLLPWLNGLPEVKEVLAGNFGGKPVNKQNLSEWRSGGYRDWQARNEVWAQVRQEIRGEAGGLAEHAGELAGIGEGRMTEHLATVLSARYASLLLHWNGEATDEFRRELRVLGELCRDVGLLRRGDHNELRLGLVTQKQMWKAGCRSVDDGELRIEDGRPEGGSPIKTEHPNPNLQHPENMQKPASSQTQSSLVKPSQTKKFFCEGRV